jgi:hypothetical protein
MKTPRLLLAAVAAATATLAVSGGAWAQASAADAPSATAIVRGTQLGHAYQSGGIGKDQVADMDHHLQRYDLRLTFSEGRHNAYAAGLAVKIADAAGNTVFALDNAGPLTDVQLPAGHYRVLADFGGVQRSAAVDVRPDAPADLYLHWPKDET